MIAVALILKNEKQLSLLQEALTDMACMDDFEPYEMHINFNPDDFLSELEQADASPPQASSATPAS